MTHIKAGFHSYTIIDGEKAHNFKCDIPPKSINLSTTVAEEGYKLRFPKEKTIFAAYK